MSWASTMRTKYLFGIGAVAIALIAIPAIVWLYEPATCFDGKLNQGEYSIDKGGPCKLLDERQLIPYATLWTRPFKIRGGAYGAVAYIENPNQNAVTYGTPYRISLYDESNVLVAEVEGDTFLMPGAITPVYVGPVDTGSREVARAFFTFLTPLLWFRAEGLSSTDVIVRNKNMEYTGDIPRLTASLENTAVDDMVDIEVVAVVFDTAGNAFAASRTVLPLLPGGETREVVFTWPDSFAKRAARVDIIPRVHPLN